MFTDYKFQGVQKNQNLNDPQSEEIKSPNEQLQQHLGLPQRLSDQSGHLSQGQDTFGRASEQLDLQSVGNLHPAGPPGDRFKPNHEVAEPFEFPRLPALELFVGFDSTEIAFLEQKVLYYLREALQNFVKEVKQGQNGGTVDQRQGHRGSFAGYVFRSEDGQSFGGEDVNNFSHVQNPFESVAQQDLGSTLPRHDMKAGKMSSRTRSQVQKKDFGSHGNLIMGGLTDELDSIASTCKQGQFPANALARNAIDSCSLFVEIIVKTLQRHTKGFKNLLDRFINKRLSLPQLPSTEYLSTKRKVVFNRNYQENVDSFAPPKYPKSEKDRVGLLYSLEKSFLTQHLHQEALQTIIDSMMLKSFKADSNIITKGETGEKYYILKTGKCEVIVNTTTTSDSSTSTSKYKQRPSPSKLLKEGDGFGEIALLYNEKRSATIHTLSDCQCWELDGPIFKNIVIKSVVQKRSTELGFLDKVNLFRNLDRFEKLSLLDGLKAQWFNKGEVIVREGEIGDLFYIVEEGHVEVWKKIINQKKKPIDRVIRKLTSGDHFGELALINNERRTLTVKCGSMKAKLLALDRATFNRILGSIESYLHLDYSDFCKSIDQGKFDDEESKRNITVDLNALREDVDGHQIQQRNWSSESSDELNSALAGDQQARGEIVRIGPKNRRSSDSKKSLKRQSQPSIGSRPGRKKQITVSASSGSVDEHTSMTYSRRSLYQEPVTETSQLRNNMSSMLSPPSHQDSRRMKHNRMQSKHGMPNQVQHQQHYFYSTTKYKPYEKILIDEPLKKAKKKVIVMGKTIKNNKRPTMSDAVHDESANRETSQADACLDSDQSSDMSESRVMGRRGHVEHTENQAMASIMTEDDANPLSENGDSNCFLYSAGNSMTPSGHMPVHERAEKPRKSFISQQQPAPLRLFEARSFSDMKISNARRIFEQSQAKEASKKPPSQAHNTGKPKPGLQIVKLIKRGAAQ